MKSLLIAPLVLLCSAPRTAPEADVSLSLAIETGTKLSKTFVTELALELEEVTLALTIDGENHPLDSPEYEMTIAQTETVTFTDEYLALEDGHTTKIRRRFDTLTETSARTSTDAEGTSNEDNEEGESELEGHTVDLTWDAEGETWSAAFAEGDEGGDDELIAELQHHADLLDFLPEGEVAIGAEWSVPAAAFVHFSNPSGELHLDTPSDKEEDDDDLQDQLDANFEGEITAKLVSVEDGLANIELTFELTTSGSIDVEIEELEESMSVEAKRTVELEFDLEGALVWHIEEGRPVSLVAEGEVGFESVQEQASDQNGAAVVFTQTQRFAGTLKLTAEIE
jgi:hypothetical protein